MRRLTKRDKPEVLADNEEQWTTEYVAARHSGVEKKHEKWRHPEIRDALSEETDRKCAYCESFVADVAYPHVEHIIPKAIHPELAHRWANLTWACPVCNSNKGDFYHATNGILNPYEDDIDEHLRFHGDFASSRLGAQRGDVTVTQLKLNRIDLVHARVRRLMHIKEMLERWHIADDPMRGVLESAIRLDAAEGEFTATVEAYLEREDFPLKQGTL
ncbi:HNH endonuclease [Nocardia sp. NPDC004573]